MLLAAGDFGWTCCTGDTGNRVEKPLFRHERQVCMPLLPWYFGGGGSALICRTISVARPRSGHHGNTAGADDRRPESLAMSTSDGAYTLASISATMALFR